jgi:pimeloyl-ACP methyl ester carboxylesterase
MGGLLTQKVAEMGLAKAVVLIASAPPWSILTIHYLPWLLRHLKQLPDLILKRPLLPSYGLAERMILNCLTEEDRRRIYTQMIPESGRVGLEILLGRVAVDERRVTCAVLVIAGGKDKIISVREAKKVSQRYNADFKEYPNRGHWMMEEGWEGIAHDISEWLEKKADLRHRIVPQAHPGGLPA